MHMKIDCKLILPLYISVVSLQFIGDNVSYNVH